MEKITITDKIEAMNIIRCCTYNQRVEFDSGTYTIIYCCDSNKTPIELADIGISDEEFHKIDEEYQRDEILLNYKNKLTLLDFDEKIFADKDFVDTVIKCGYDGSAMMPVPMLIKLIKYNSTNKELAKYFLNEFDGDDPDCWLEHFDKSLLDDYATMLEFVKINPLVLLIAGPNIRKNKEIFEIALQKTSNKSDYHYILSVADKTVREEIENELKTIEKTREDIDVLEQKRTYKEENVQILLDLQNRKEELLKQNEELDLQIKECLESMSTKGVEDARIR